MKQHFYRVIISYKGSNYFGWQDLGDAGEKPTVQFVILQVLRKISKYAECVVAGASRTDASVHALGQVAKLSTPLQIDPAKLQLGMNSLLPEDIRIRECVSCVAAFNPNTHAVSKTYRYYFSIAQISVPLLRDIVAHVPLLAANPHDAEQSIAIMKLACKQFIGRHDFASFSTGDDDEKSTVRTMLNVELQKSANSEFGADIYYLEIEGDGFLRHMLRYILGALFEVGRGNIDSDALGRAITEPGRTKLSPKAKPRGLHLVRINY
jgi:tRNA pseudouridine38-40 synthase